MKKPKNSKEKKMTAPNKGAQRPVDDCIRMASWNIKEVSDSLKAIAQELLLIRQAVEKPRAPAKSSEDSPF